VNDGRAVRLEGDELNASPRFGVEGKQHSAQEAVEAHFHGETEVIPGPSAPEAWEGHEDFEGGFWMMVDIDLSKVNAKAVRLNISLPENLVHRIDAVAKAQHLSRSAFLAKAAEREMTEA
jgi:hypothetical protein